MLKEDNEAIYGTERGIDTISAGHFIEEGIAAVDDDYLLLVNFKSVNDNEELMEAKSSFLFSFV